ncbi:MAG: hypothetical protein GXY38_04205 [Planctomycetes bacterium]|nr:hypothetical protein [Planctomycetota bacterium]
MLCRIRQFQISAALDNGRDVSRSLRRHINKCDRCREFWQNILLLGAELSDQAATVAHRPAFAHRVVWPLWRPALAAAAIIIAAVALWATVFRSTGADPDGTAGVPVVTAPPLRLDGQETIAVAQMCFTSLEETTRRSMRSELDGLSTDLQSAAKVLAGYIPQPARTRNTQ